MAGGKHHAATTPNTLPWGGGLLHDCRAHRHKITKSFLLSRGLSGQKRQPSKVARKLLSNTSSSNFREHCDKTKEEQALAS